jgi:uncharacterized membrane protein
MMDVDTKFGDWIKEGFELYKDNIGVLILSALFVFGLSIITLGVLLGPMIVGLILIILRLKDGDQTPPSAGDVFQGFQYFLPSFLFWLVWVSILSAVNLILSFIPCLGPIMSVCISLAAGAFLMFGFFLIADKKMDFWAASMASIEKVKPIFFPLLGLSVVASIIGSAGLIACFIGVIVTLPIQYAIIAVAYRDLFGGGAVSPVQKTQPAAPVPPESPAEPSASGTPEGSGDEKE